MNNSSNQSKSDMSVVKPPRRVPSEDEGWVTVTKIRRGRKGWKSKERIADKLLGIV